MRPFKSRRAVLPRSPAPRRRRASIKDHLPPGVRANAALFLHFVRLGARLATSLFCILMLGFLLMSPEAESMRSQWADGDRLDLISAWFWAWAILVPFAAGSVALCHAIVHGTLHSPDYDPDLERAR